MSTYADEISKIELLSQEETIHLFKLLKAGDISARKKLIEHNMRLVLKLAYKYQLTLNLRIEELISIGAEGLIKAIDNFDVEQNLKLSTIAYICIENSFKSHIRASNTQKRHNSNDISLQYEISKNSEGNGYTLEEVIEDKSISLEDSIIHQIDIETLNLILNELTTEEKEILFLKYGILDGINYTYKEIGIKIGCSKQNVHIRMKTILKKITESKLYNTKLKKKGKI